MNADRLLDAFLASAVVLTVVAVILLTWDLVNVR